MWMIKRNPRKFVLKQMPKNSVCAEIGVYRGDFSHQILRTVRPRALHLIDPWKFESSEPYGNSWYGGAVGFDQAHMDSIYRSVQERFRAETVSGRVSVHRRASGDAAPEFEDGYFDWIYVDGNHLYEFVTTDLESYYPKVKCGGFIAGDDYANEGWWGDGVRRAVDEFVSRGRCQMVSVKNNQFILKKTA